MSRQEPVWLSVVNRLETVLTGTKAPADGSSTPKGNAESRTSRTPGSGSSKSGGQRGHAPPARKHPSNVGASPSGDIGHLLFTPSASAGPEVEAAPSTPGSGQRQKGTGRSKDSAKEGMGQWGQDGEQPPGLRSNGKQVSGGGTRGNRVVIPSYQNRVVFEHPARQESGDVELTTISRTATNEEEGERLVGAGQSASPKATSLPADVGQTSSPLNGESMTATTQEASPVSPEGDSSGTSSAPDPSPASEARPGGDFAPTGPGSEGQRAADLEERSGTGSEKDTAVNLQDRPETGPGEGTPVDVEESTGAASTGAGFGKERPLLIKTEGDGGETPSAGLREPSTPPTADAVRGAQADSGGSSDHEGDVVEPAGTAGGLHADSGGPSDQVGDVVEPAGAVGGPLADAGGSSDHEGELLEPVDTSRGPQEDSGASIVPTGVPTGPVGAGRGTQPGSGGSSDHEGEATEQSFQSTSYVEGLPDDQEATGITGRDVSNFAAEDPQTRSSPRLPAEQISLSSSRFLSVDLGSSFSLLQPDALASVKHVEKRGLQSGQPLSGDSPRPGSADRRSRHFPRRSDDAEALASLRQSDSEPQAGKPGDAVTNSAEAAPRGASSDAGPASPSFPGDQTPERAEANSAQSTPRRGTRPQGDGGAPADSDAAADAAEIARFGSFSLLGGEAFRSANGGEATRPWTPSSDAEGPGGAVPQPAGASFSPAPSPGGDDAARRKARKRRGIIESEGPVLEDAPASGGALQDFSLSPWMGRQMTEAERQQQEALRRSPRGAARPQSADSPTSPRSQPSTAGGRSSATGGTHIPGHLPEPLTPGEPGRSEREYYATYITAQLAADPELADRLPLTVGDREQLVAACRDGVLLCKLLNSVVPDAVDERALNRPAGADVKLPRWQALENSTLCLKAAGSVGCSMPSVSPEDLTEGKESAIMECIWQVIRLALLRDINVARVPDLVVLRLPEEEAAALLNVSPEQLLRRWVNLHLAKAGSLWHRGPVDNLSTDFVDSYAYACLLHQLAPTCGLPLPLQVEGLLERAEIVLTAARSMTTQALPPASAVAEADERLNLALLATLFHADNGLAGLMEDADGQLDQFARWLESYKIMETREDRTFCVWMSTFLEAGDAAITNLSESLKDGYLLLRVLDQLAPGCVSWRKAHRPPFKPLLRRPASVENCSQVMELTRNLLKLPLVNIGPEDILNGDKKLTGALLWQLMRFHIRSLLQAVSGRGAAISDTDLDREIIAWANARVASAAADGQPSRAITSFHDSTIASGLFLLDLLAAMEPGAINASAVTPGVTEEEREMNARYIISIARKLGADIFLLWEDIVEVKPKMILVFIACLQLCDSRRNVPASA